jgi:alpha-L-rhamnosidase
MKYYIKNAFIIFALMMAGLTSLQAEDRLKNGFIKPPASARPWFFYFALNGNLTKEGITADLEAMARVGIGGLVYFEVDQGTPKGKADFAGPLWIELIKHAINEAQRLGLEINMHNNAGWCGSGGPWITPELSMQNVVWSETRVEGGKTFAGALAKPEAVKNFYCDIAVLAFPTPAVETVNMSEAMPKFSSSGENPQPGQFTLMQPEGNGVQYLQIQFPQPFAARVFTAEVKGMAKRVRGQLQVSDDGENFKSVQTFNIAPPTLELSFALQKSRFYQLVFNKVDDPKEARIEVSSLNLSQRYRIENIRSKISLQTLHKRADIPPAPASWPTLPAETAIPRDRIVDLTGKMDATGKLTYDFPAGNWTVLRFGHTSTGQMNRPAPAAGSGLECDKLSKAAAQVAFNSLMGRLIAENKALSGQNKVLVATHIDSWEVGGQNWTPLMREEFKQRRGYDLLKLLPAFTGRVVDNIEVTERFLWDLRQTVSDMIVENYAGEFRRLANEQGLRLSIEAYGGPVDEMTYGGQADEPMAEFWAWPKFNPGTESCTEMASSAHTYGKKILSAEAFTSHAIEKWQSHPGNMKDLGDWAFCEGINRFVFHRYAAQPWTTVSPGMSMGPFGVHYERTQTWWEQSKAWHDYVARCQSLLQQGLFVADVAYLQPEGAPRGFKPPADAMIAQYIRSGYNFDGCTPEVVLTRMSVKNGRIVLPDGMSYAVLVLPEVETITPKLLRKIAELANQGATVIAGSKPPQKSPSLGDMGQGDIEVKKLAEELWNSGKIIVGKTAAEVLGGRGVKPDFSATPNLRYIHRTMDAAEVYFVANPEPKQVDAIADFRITGKQPEFWWPESGRIEPVNDFEIKDGITRIPLRLDPSGSVFVIFRQTTQTNKGTGKNWVETTQIQEIKGAWQVSFDPKWGGPTKPVTFDKLQDWSKSQDAGIKYYAGHATYTITFQAKKSKCFLDLGKVAILAEVKLNGKDLGILWKSPFRVDITDAIQTGENKLEVKVVNLLINRMIGDEQLPDDSNRNANGTLKSWPQWVQEGKQSPTGRFTFGSWMLWKKDDPLVESGLIGPVTIQSIEIIK